MSKKGFYKPKNPQKYKGDPTNIIYRSMLEYTFMRYLDHKSAIIQWSSEELWIPYRSPVDGRVHRYFPDFWVKYLDKNQQEQQMLVEIKPYVQTIEPKRTHHRARLLKEAKVWSINQAKWEAANKYCINKNWVFKIITDKDLK